MNHPTEVDRVFPLSTGSSEPARLKAPRVFPAVSVTPGFVMGNRAFLRTWAGRRLLHGTVTLGRTAQST
jgi:hypothetical protein